MEGMYCERREQNGCKFLYWEEEYIHILTEHNLVDVVSLLASTEARDEISALVDTPTRIEARHEARCEEATSTSLHSKKKEARKIEPPQINNECIKKALIQLTGVVKCILVVLVFFGLAFLVKIIVGVRAKRRSVWGRALQLALQVGPQLRKPTIGKPPPRPPHDG